ALAGDAGAGRPLDVACPAAGDADQRLDDEFGRRRQRLLVRLSPPARPGAAQSRPVRGAQDHPLCAVTAPDGGPGVAHWCRRASGSPGGRPCFPPHVALWRRLMRRLALLAALLCASPAIAGPQDAWTIDPRASALSFSASQIGGLITGRFPA